MPQRQSVPGKAVYTKMAGILEYSSTAASNTTINGIGIAGSNSVKNGDDALRQLMADTASAITKVVDKSGTYTALKADYNQMIRATGTLTLSLTAAATLTSGWCLWVKADGGAVTIDPNSTEQINGASTLALADDFSAFIVCTGTAFRAVVFGNGDVTLTGTQTLTNKTLTTPTITLKQSTGPAPTAEGDIQWDTNDDRIVVGDGASQKTFSDDTKVLLKTGGTMTGKITLDGDPSSALHAATKQYVDAIDIPATLAGLSVGAVGTWAYLIPATGGAATYNPGTTLAGSSLNYSGSQFSGGTTRGTSPSGTWRCMGQSARNSTDANCYSTAWLRIS